MKQLCCISGTVVNLGSFFSSCGLVFLQMFLYLLLMHMYSSTSGTFLASLKTASFKNVDLVRLVYLCSPSVLYSFRYLFLFVQLVKVAFMKV